MIEWFKPHSVQPQQKCLALTRITIKILSNSNDSIELLSFLKFWVKFENWKLKNRGQFT